MRGCYIQHKIHLSRTYEVLAWHRGLAVPPLPPPPHHPSPSFRSIFNPPPTPSLPLRCPHFTPRTPNWLWKMASVSHLGTEIKGKLQPTSMQNVIWKPPSYVLTIDFSLFSSIPSLSLHPFLLISPLHFYPSTIQHSVKSEEKKGPESSST